MSSIINRDSLRIGPKDKIQVWLPEIFNFKGGIQVYTNLFLDTLQTVCSHCSYDVLLKHDTNPTSDRSFLPSTKLHFAGTWPLHFRTAAYASQILGFALWQKPTLVISGHLNFSGAAYCLKRLTGIPYWIITYGLEAWDVQSPVLKTALREADRIISISSYTRDRLLKEQNLASEKVSLLPCVVDANRFRISPKPTYLLERHGLYSEQPIILTVARLAGSQRFKGYDKILEALPLIRQAFPNVHYIIVGKGNDRPRIEQMIAQRQLQDCVTLAGFVPDSELCDYYNLCDLFAMPSKLEGFGIVYLEALACGKPTLGGNQDGAIDALCHGELGALVAPDDAGNIAYTIIDILRGTYPNTLLYQPEYLRQKVIENFGFERFKQTLASLMKNSPIGADL